MFLRQRGNVNNSLATKFSVLKAVYNKAVSEGVSVATLHHVTNTCNQLTCLSCAWDAHPAVREQGGHI
ncbi:phage integrase SAM-like domain-containing protein [Alistipes sp.]|uniref:phage integrase SAM-like domain-containing protein n=1 Tax=Alistipes sp. TaxID=1872444 RepID=UPI0040251CC0